MQRDHTIQPKPVAFDPGPSIADIDRDLASVAIATLERYARDLDPAAIGNRPWEALPVSIRRALRAGNELARRQNEKERADRQAAEDARLDAQHAARVEAKIAAYKDQARGAFPGTKEDFDREWPRLLSDWQREQTRAALDANTARIRMNGF